MTLLDDCDYNLISSKIKIDFKSEIKKVLPELNKYFGNLSILLGSKYKENQKYFKHEPFLSKNHIIQKKPVRIRKIINDSCKKTLTSILSQMPWLFH